MRTTIIYVRLQYIISFCIIITCIMNFYNNQIVNHVDWMINSISHLILEGYKYDRKHSLCLLKLTNLEHDIMWMEDTFKLWVTLYLWQRKQYRDTRDMDIKLWFTKNDKKSLLPWHTIICLLLHWAAQQWAILRYCVTNCVWLRMCCCVITAFINLCRCLQGSCVHYLGSTTRD